MTAELAALRPITREEYLRAEKLSETKHEFVNGEVAAMAGASDDHELVAMNVAGLLHQHLRGKGCRVYKSDMKLSLELHQFDLFYYPDVMVVCDPDDADSQFKTRPKVLVEVMSDYKKDHLEKLFAYQQIGSLEDYLIVDQDPQKSRAWLYRRETGWERESISTDGTVHLKSIGFSVLLRELYQA